MDSYIIVQAGGQGTHLRPLTNNKPKALVSVRGEPMLLHLMRRNPQAEFLIIAYYKKDILRRYLSHFAKEFNYRIIDREKDATSAGIAHALEYIPDDTPFVITWCDLWYEDLVHPAHLDVVKNNYIGLSKTFSCRWSFNNDSLVEKPSATEGIAGVFLFKDKKEIADVPENAEFCAYLRQKGIRFHPYHLENVVEIGTMEAYRRYSESFAYTRPFNSISFESDWVIKQSLGEQGNTLARHESDWYRHTARFDFNFIPKVFSFAPLTLERIQGIPLGYADVPLERKEHVLVEALRHLQLLHAADGVNVPNAYENNCEAILHKTKRRLDSVIDLVPYSADDAIIINGRRCVNFYTSWELVERMCEPYLHESAYRLIHGDPTFSNTLYDAGSGKTYLIDPRGYYGAVELYGDPAYDWAKVYYSIAGNYDQFNRKNFRLSFDGGGAELSIASNGWEETADVFFSETKADPRKVRLFHAIIWLSLASYAWDDYDSICGAFYNGIQLLMKCYEETF